MGAKGANVIEWGEGGQGPCCTCDKERTSLQHHDQTRMAPRRYSCRGHVYNCPEPPSREA